MTKNTILIVGGSSGIGLELARDLISSGNDVIVTSRSQSTAERTADALGGSAQGCALDGAEPESIADQLKAVG